MVNRPAVHDHHVPGTALEEPDGKNIHHKHEGELASCPMMKQTSVIPQNPGSPPGSLRLSTNELLRESLAVLTI
jgi:hypothetical protein